MHYLKKSTHVILASAILLLASLTTAAPTQKDPAQKWLAYLFQIHKSADIIRAVMVNEAEKETDPDRKKFSNEVIPTFDEDVFILKISPLVSSALTKRELDQCVAFTASPAGQKVLSTTNKYSTFMDAVPSLEAMPTDVRSFFSSTCYKKTINTLNSPQYREISRAYGIELACNKFQKDVPEQYKNLKQRGYCN